MFMAFMSVLIICSAPLMGGKLGRLASIRLRHTWLILLALGVQILITDVFPTAPRPLLVTLHLASYAAAGVALWANRALPGLVLIGTGAILNAGAIALNGGTLPASARALAAAGLPTDTSTFANSGVIGHPVLPWLGDILATPAWLPFRNVISIGDMIILVGACVLVHAVSRNRPPRLCTRLRHHHGRADDRLSPDARR
jgi:hypothetical protein